MSEGCGMSAQEAADRCARALAALAEAEERRFEAMSGWALQLGAEIAATQRPLRVPPYVWTVDPAVQDRAVTERLLERFWQEREAA